MVTENKGKDSPLKNHMIPAYFQPGMWKNKGTETDLDKNEMVTKDITGKPDTDYLTHKFSKTITNFKTELIEPLSLIMKPIMEQLYKISKVYKTTFKVAETVMEAVLTPQKEM